jgi:ATP-dependent RNA helicase HelY
MLPGFKETVEEVFEAGLVKVVFATETLSLGINMPAKSVVIEDLWKFQGERHELLTPGEYTQLTGRAGRRGIDQLGHAIVAYQRQVAFERVASLASTRTYELTSSFRPSYNMAVNLVRNYTREEAHHLLNSSFAQFLADRGVVSLERQLERDKAYLAGYHEQMRCEQGDFAEYWSLRERATHVREEARKGRDRARQDAIRDGLNDLRPGDVIFVPRAKRRGLAVVLSNREGRPTVLAQDRRFFRLSNRDLDEPPSVMARIPLPRSGSVRSARYRRDLAARLVALDVRPSKRLRERIDAGVEREATRFERLAEDHPCHACPDRAQHEHWARRASDLERQVAGIERRIRSRTETLARQFERVLEVLEELGYVRGFSIAPKGRMLARIYGEGDILVAEGLAEGLFVDVTPPEAAALVSAIVYESRERVPRQGRMPTAETVSRSERLRATWDRIRRVEDAHHVELCRELEDGFASTIHRWAIGDALEDVLADADMAPGDFVRTCKQLLDLLRQIEEVATDDTAQVMAAAREAVDRGVVSYTGV